MLIAWSWALFSLYRDVKHSEKLLPDKKIFLLHGSLLTAFLVLLLAQTIIQEIADKQTTPTYEPYTLYGIVDLLGFIFSCVEMATFYLVVFLMMRITKASNAKYVALQKFLLNGFVNPEELEAAVFA